MNNGRIWCVVSPTVGLPLFLGSVATMAFTVHFAVLNNTTWFKDYWNGAARAKVGMNDAVKPALAKSEGGTAAFVVNTQPVAQKSGDASASFVVTVTQVPSPEGGATRTAANDTR